MIDDDEYPDNPEGEPFDDTDFDPSPEVPIDEEVLADYDISAENIEEPVNDPFDETDREFPPEENETYDGSPADNFAGNVPADNSETEPLDTQDSDQPEAGPFIPDDKSAASNFIQSKPKKLNKQLVLYIIGGVLIAFIVFTMFIAPLVNFGGKSKRNEGKPRAETVGRTTDYYALVPREEIQTNDFDEYVSFAEDDDIPPVIDPAYQYREPEQPQNTTPASGGGGGSGSSRPDTRNDHLQAKSISGIKGITPSQRQYLSGDVPYAPYTQNPGQGPDPTNPYAQFNMPTKEAYTAQMLQYQTQNTGAAYSYNQQNDQGGKLNFYNQGRENTGNGYWLNPASIWPGTIFEATLTSNINTDLPGECTAMVTKNVYSSVDGRLLLIPMNSRLLGTYNSSISYAQGRVQVGWHTLIRPDGYYINLGNMQATDPRGAAGLPGFINDHPFQYLKAIALLSAMNIINSELGSSTAGTNNQYVQNVMANTQEVANILGGKLIDRALDVQPTITIKAGTAINIVANTNLVLPPMEPYPVKYPYHRGE